MAQFTEPSRPARRQLLDAKPLRLFDATPRNVAPGQWRLTVPLRPKAWISFVIRQPRGVEKTFELDDIGKAVWESCDGKTSIRDLIEQLARRYDLNVREVEVATLAFLKTLVQKGLVGMPAKESQ